jgi:AAA family ATP:ADP antiporter
MDETPVRRTLLERLLAHFTLLRPREGPSVMVFFLIAFLILVAYYILKTLREPLLLVDATAEMKSYAYAAIALVLLVLIPMYGRVFRRTSKRQLTRWVTAFFVVNLMVFYVVGRLGYDIGFVYYVWVGIVSLMLTAQFWGYAADTYNLKSGQRLFPVIMLGATLGGLLGPLIAGALFSRLGPWNLMLIVGLLLLVTIPLYGPARDAVPAGSRNERTGTDLARPHFMGGLAMVVRDHYLLLLAVLIVLLNWVNTTGEYILAELVVRYADARVLEDAALDKGELIAGFYGGFYFAVNAFTVAIQLLFVARIFRWAGLGGAILVLPVIVLLGYGLIVFLPVFAVIRIFKVAENSVDYSLMNTARHALYLPLGTSHKYEGKTAIETFFWRLGDLIQAGVIFAGLHWFVFGVEQFALLNMALALVWLLVALRLGVLYKQQAKAQSTNRSPIYTHPVGPVPVPAGKPFRIALPPDCFTDPDPGDVLIISARKADGSPLPRWLRFDGDALRFSGSAPPGLTGITELTLRARDFDGAVAEGRLVLDHG